GLALRLANGGSATSLVAPQITLVGDRIQIDTTANYSITASTSATLRPNTAGTLIDVGSTAEITANAVELSNSELQKISTPTINIGNATSGTINVTSAITRSPAITNFNVTSGGSINITTGTINTNGGNLVLAPGGSGSVGVSNTNTDVTVAAGTLSFAGNGNVGIPINGTGEGQPGGFDLLRLLGNVNLAGANLVLSGTYAPMAGNAFQILNNLNSANTTTGTFTGLPESKVLSALQITYKGGDGNDVILTALDNANPSLQGTAVNDTWLVKRNGNNVDITLNGTVIWSPLFSSLTSLTINGLAGADTLTVDSSAGDPFPSGGIVFHGGNNSGDKVITTGGTYTTITNNYTSTGPGHSGNIVFAGSQTDTLTYDGLAPIDISGSPATNLVFNLPGSTSTAFLENDGSNGNSIAQLRSSNGTFETTAFRNPSGILTIKPGTANDTLTVNTLLGTDFNAGLAIGAAGSEFGAVTFAGGLTLAANNSLAVNALGAISLPNQGSDLAVSGTGAVSFTTARNISLGDGSSIKSVDGPITLSANQQATATSGTFAGVDINNTSIAPSIQATGNGLITISGRGGDGTSSNQYGVYVTGDVKGGTAGVRITGVGGGSGGTSLTNNGVFVFGTVNVSATGAGPVIIDGTGGPVGQGSAGVSFNGGTVTTGTGDIQITGHGGGGPTSANAVGVVVLGAQITPGGSGAVSIQGFASAATGITNYGVSVLGLTTINSAGPVQITGTEGSAASSYAISVFAGTVSSSSS
ncbi:MAG: hypothetical protein JF612_07685, partial [Planctomycetia bacterium]|nr:hypothetical protein [Planctomycetia bacterium]